MDLPGHVDECVEIERLLASAAQQWKRLGTHWFGNVPDVGQLTFGKSSQKLSKGDCRTRSHHDFVIANHPERYEMFVNLGFRSHARMKWSRDTSEFEESPSLLANAHPWLVGRAVSPFVQHDSIVRQDTTGFSENGAPIRRQVEKPGNHDDVEGPVMKRESRPFCSERQHATFPILSPQLLHHAHRRFNRHDLATLLGKGNGDASSAGTDVKDPGTRAHSGGTPQAAEPLVRQAGPVSAVVNRRVGGKVDAFAHDKQSPLTAART